MTPNRNLVPLPNHRIAALIISQPGLMRDSLRALLIATSRFRQVDEVDDLSHALKKPTEISPAFVLLDLNLPDHEVELALKQIKALWTRTRCLVLVEDRRDKITKDSGADGVLHKGFSSSELFEMIKRLLGEDGAATHNGVSATGIHHRE